MNITVKSVVTGASAGIGRSLTEGLLNRGHRVIGVARRRDRLDEMAAAHAGFVPFAADIREPSAREGLLDLANSSGGAPDYLILNAGLAHYGLVHRLEPAQIHEMIDTNLVAVIDLIHLFLPGMIARQRGRIIVVSSVLGVGAIPYANVYSATKFAVNGLVRGLRMDLHGTGVSVSAMCPAGVATEFHGVATGQTGRQRSGQEPVERVVKGMLQQLDKDQAIIYPTFRAATAGFFCRWFPGLLEKIMGLPGVREGQKGNIPPERLLY